MAASVAMMCGRRRPCPTLVNTLTNRRASTVRGLTRALALLLVVGVPVLAYGMAIFGVDDYVGYDFREATLPAAEQVLNGHSPYPEPEAITGGSAHTYYVYPPLLALVAAPATLLSVE